MRLAVIGLLASLSLQCSALMAETFSADDAEAVATLLEGYGMKTDLSAGSDGRPVIVTSLDDDHFLLVFTDCDDAFRACDSVVMFSTYQAIPSAADSVIQTWLADNPGVFAKTNERGFIELSQLVTDLKNTSSTAFRDAMVSWIVTSHEFRQAIGYD